MGPRASRWVEIRPARVGDANLDDLINLGDMNLVIANWLDAGYSRDGDVNYDGVVNFGAVNVITAIM